MAHTHPRAKTTYMTHPKCLNVIHQNISLYILFHAILSYLNLTNPHKHICCEKKQRMADTHLSIETTYIAYPICYTMMLPNMPFRKADAHPLRLNTRCKDLTLVPSSGEISLAVRFVSKIGRPKTTRLKWLINQNMFAIRIAISEVYLIFGHSHVAISGQASLLQPIP